MHTDPSHPDLCQSIDPVGENVHRCYRDAGHDGPHICVCWHRWPGNRVA